jgi:pyridoxal/pyridoxine/pyridoxamine kinase
MDGLHHNGLDHYSHLLTGYIGSASFLKYIAQVVKQLREVNPDLVYGKNGFTSAINEIFAFSYAPP